jgi:micrococcal nuclease
VKPIPRLLLIGSALLILTARHVAEVPATPDTGVVLAIHDGDTISVRVAGEVRHVRLISEDSPEIGQGPPGTAARDWLALACPPGSTVTLVPDSHHPPDSYGRALRWVAFGDLDQHEPLNVAIVRAGHAYAWRPIGHRVDRWDEMVAAEAEARAARRGVWAAGDGGGERPWEYRKRIKRERERR